MKIIAKIPLLIIPLVLLRCSIHIGNPKDFDSTDKKAKPEVAVNVNSDPMEQGEELNLSFNSVTILRADGKRTELSNEASSSLQINAGNSWLDQLVAAREVDTGSYIGIELAVSKGTIGSVIVDGTEIPVLPADENDLVYEVPMDFVVEAGKSSQVFINFVEYQALEAVKEDGVLRYFKLKNGFNVEEVSVTEVDAKTLDIVEYSVTAAFVKDGILFHYDAGVPNSLFVNQDCTIAVTTEGESVACWKDLSGNGWNISQQGGGRRPLVSSNQFGDRVGLVFDGNDDRLDRDIAMLNSISAHTVIAVGKFNDLQASNRLFTFGEEGPGNANRHIDMGVENGLYMSSFFRNKAYYGQGQANLPVIMVSRFTGGDTASATSRSLYINGVVQNLSSSDNPGGDLLIPAASKLVLGGEPIDGAERLGGVVSELILYDRALTQAELDQLNAYLKEKYGY